MSYQRFAVPRAYVDLISYNLAHGWSAASNITMLQDDGSTAVTFDGGQKEDMFDLRPSNAAQIASTNQAFYIQYDTEFATDSLAESSFIAILNHNFHSADVVFKVQIDDASDMGSATTVTTTGSHTKVINAAADAGAGYIDPANNGWTLITWNTQTSDNRYVRITLEDDAGTGSNFDTDVYIGAILYGEYVDWQHAMDVGLSTSFDYDGTTLQNSAGGSTYATSTHFGQPAWSLTQPWTNTTTANQQQYSFARMYGRRRHSMNFSHITDTNLYDDNIVASPGFFTGTDLHSQFYNKVLGQHSPFLFSIDGTSTTEGDYGMFRLAQSDFTANQVSSRSWNVKMDLMESW